MSGTPTIAGAGLALLAVVLSRLRWLDRSAAVVLLVAAVAVELLGAVPNPFNPATTIVFELEREMPARIAVFDLGGRLVTELADRQFSAGDHAVRWSGTNTLGQSVPSGTYLLRLESADGVRSDKMMLVR